MNSGINKKNSFILLPLLGILFFVSLYIIASFYYPGGSQADKWARGFSWVHNYWCNLLNTTALNGQPNAARPIAITAMGVLCGVLCWFWYFFPLYMNARKKSRLIIQFSGTAAMIISSLLYTTGFHDVITNIAGLCGLVAIVSTLQLLHKKGWPFLFRLGLFNLVLVVLNNVLYHTPGLLFYLPVVQKISFLFFLGWICLLSICLWKQQKNAGKAL